VSASPIDWDALRTAAHGARARAHAPYSGYSVGAALLAEDGRVFTAANVENASYGLTICAERAAIGSAIAAGAKRFAAIAIASPGDVPAPPCGMCRQVLAEFPPSFPVRSYAERGEPLVTDVASLLPHAFVPAMLAQSARPRKT
jgi:cytidine deaminase